MRNKVTYLKLLAALPVSMIHFEAEAQPTDSLAIEQAVELRFKTSKGKIYTLEGSDDFDQWRAIGGTGYGNGRIQKHFLSVGDANQNLKFFRLNVSDNAESGFAPVSLAGTRFILNTGGFPLSVDFLADGLAERASANGMDAVAFQYSKTSEDKGILEIEDGTRRLVYSLEFTGAEAGAFRLETMLGDRIDDIDVGTFTLQSAVNLPPVPGGSELPPVASVPHAGLVKSDLSGLSFVFNDGGEPIWVQFEDAQKGRVIDDDEIESFVYRIEDVTEAEQKLLIDFGDDYGLELNLAYSGECSGTYIMREIEGGDLEDVDMGTFSVSTEPIDVPDDKDGDHDGDDDDDEDGDHDGDDDDEDGDHDDDEDGDHDGDDDDEDGDHDDDEDGDHDGDDDDEDGDHDGGEDGHSEGGDEYPIVAILSGSDRSEKLQGFESDDSVTGGAGADLFPLTLGTDVITDFNPLEDMIDVGDFARASDGFETLTSLASLASHSAEITDESGNPSLVIDVDGTAGNSSTTLLGVTLADLNEANVFFGLGASPIPPLVFTHIAEILVTFSSGDVVLFPAHDLEHHPVEGQLISLGIGKD